MGKNMGKYYDPKYLAENFNIDIEEVKEGARVLQRECALIGKNFGFCGAGHIPSVPGFFSNLALLECVVASCDIDLRLTERLQDTQLSDAKKAAYLLYWMSKIKPVQLTIALPINNTTYLMLNELCGFWLACRIIGVDPDRVDPKHLENILYLLCYCEPSVESLFVILESLPYQYPKTRTPFSR